MNSTSSRWNFNPTKFTSLNNLNNRIEKSTPHLRNVTHLQIQLYYKFTRKNGVATPLNIKFNNKNIQFFAYDIHYFETSAAGNRMERNYSLIIYKVTGKNIIYAIIDKNSGSLPLLRAIFGFENRNEIQSASPSINNYLLLWLVNRVYNNKKTFSNTGININLIMRIKGDSNNSDSKVNISGNDTMSSLSALSFLLESKKLNRVMLKMSYKRHRNFKLKLDTNSTIGVTDYAGVYYTPKYQNRYGKDCNEFLPYLLVYCDVVPKILLMFKKSKYDRTSYALFLKKLITDIQRRVKIRITEVKRGNF